MSPKNPELAAAMARTGLNIRELAAKVGIDPATVSCILNLRRKPRRLTARAIAEALDTTPEVLFGREGIK